MTVLKGKPIRLASLTASSLTSLSALIFMTVFITKVYTTVRVSQVQLLGLQGKIENRPKVWLPGDFQICNYKLFPLFFDSLGNVGWNDIVVVEFHHGTTLS